MNNVDWEAMKLGGILLAIYLGGLRIAWFAAEKYNESLKPEEVANKQWPPSLVGVAWPIYVFVLMYLGVAWVFNIGLGKPLNWIWYASGKTLEAIFWLYTGISTPKAFKKFNQMKIETTIVPKTENSNPWDAWEHNDPTPTATEAPQPTVSTVTVPIQQLADGTAQIGPVRNGLSTTDGFQWPPVQPIPESNGIPILSTRQLLMERFQGIPDANTDDPLGPRPPLRYVRDDDLTFPDPSPSSPIEVVIPPPTKEDDVFDTL